MERGVRELPARALEVLRRDGPSGLRLRALDATVYRHLLITCRPLTRPEERADGPVGVSFLQPGEVSEYAAFRPDTATAEIRRRLDAGHRCMVARRDGAIVHARWISAVWLESAYLGLSFELPATSVYVYDTFTASHARRRGVSVNASAFYRGVLRAEGMQRVLGSVWPGNVAARRMLSATGQEEIGALGAVRLGSLKIPVRRWMPPGHVGAAHPFEPGRG